MINNTWTKIDIGAPVGWVLTSTGWKLKNDCITGQTVTYTVSSDSGTNVNFCDGTTERIVARVVDAGGKTLTALGLQPPVAHANTLMPEGSQLYWLEFLSTQDKYYLYTGNKVTDWTVPGGSTFSTLDAFIQKYQTPSLTGRAAYFVYSGLYFSFDVGGNSLTLWNPATGQRLTESGSYERKTVYGQEVLVIKTQAPENRKGDLIMFAVKDGYVYGGSSTIAAVVQTSDPMLNKTMANAILNAGKLPPVKD